MNMRVERYQTYVVLRFRMVAGYDCELSHPSVRTSSQTTRQINHMILNDRVPGVDEKG